MGRAAWRKRGLVKPTCLRDVSNFMLVKLGEALLRTQQESGQGVQYFTNCACLCRSNPSLHNHTCFD